MSEQIGEAYVAIRADTAADFTASLGKVGTAIKAAVGVVAGGAVVKGLESIGSTFDDMTDTIRLGTGATGDALDALADSARKVGAGIPVSFGDAGTAIADLNTTLGLTGKPLEDLSTQMLNLSRISGTDLSSNITNITRVFGDWGVATEDQGETIDKLWRAAQSTGIGIDQLSSQVVQFGAPLRQLGFSFDDAAAMLGKWQKEGVNSELVLGGMKKALATFAKDGEAAPEAFRRLTDEIKGMQDPTAATQRAIEIFGTRAGPDMAAAIREGRFDFEAYTDAIANGADTVNQAAADTDDWRERLEVFGNKALLWIEPIADRVFSSLTSGVEWAAASFQKYWPKIEPIVKSVGETIGRVVDGITEAWDYLRGGLTGEFTNEGSGIMLFANQVGMAIREVIDWVVANWPSIEAAFQATIDVLAEIWTGIGQPIFDAIVAAVQAIVDWFVLNWPTIEAVVTAVFTEIAGFVAEVWPQIQQIITDAITAIQTVIGVVLTAIQFVWDKWGADITEALSATWDAIKQVIQGALDIIQGIIRLVTDLIKGDWGKAWEDVKQVVSGVWETIKGIVDGAIAELKLIVSIGLDLVKGAAQAVWDGITSAASTAWDAVKTAVTTVIDDVWGAISGLPDLIIGLAEDFLSAGLSIGSSILDGLKSALGAAVDLAVDIASAVKNALIDAINWVIDKMNAGIPNSLGWGPASIDLPDNPIPRISKHSGGIVPGAPGADVPILAKAGEGLFTADQMDALGGLLRGRPAGPVVYVENQHFYDQLDVEAFARYAGSVLAYAGVS